MIGLWFFFRQEVTHIVTGLTFEEDVWEKLKSKPLPHVNVVSPLWHADSIRAKCLLPVEEYRLIFRRLPPSVSQTISRGMDCLVNLFFPDKCSMYNGWRSQ